MRELPIVRLGAQGDGVADSEAGPVFVPFALPGERVRTGGQGLPEVVAGASPDRRGPICRHFGTCGGCAAQHMSERLYAEWKRGIVVEAFRQRGLAPEIAPLLPVPVGSRRRAVLTARREGSKVTLGYHGRASQQVLGVEECPVLVAAIVEQLAGLGALAALLPARELRLTVLATRAGLDVAIAGGGGRVEPGAAAQMATLALRHRFARISVDGAPIVERAAPALVLAGAEVVPPPGGFVQAVAEAEAAMTALVVAGASKARRVADLFCGPGTFTFALARSARVLAVDSDAAATAALAAAARRAQGLKPIEVKVRDLFRMPLSARELEGFEAVVLDPARAGARAQSEELARSSVATIVAVSCNPATLARDVRLLADGGYRIERVTPIDQFLFSAHVEAVAVLRRS